ncbi:MAG: hypothetical protein ACLRFM_03800 [Alphaproteobacteria bacterium]
MINITDIFENKDVADKVSWWLGDNVDAAELAGAAENAVDVHVPALSVVSRDVSVLWPWVEKFNIKIIPRFYLMSSGADAVAAMSVDIKSSFKQGADGAHVIVKLTDLDRFADLMLPVRDDLFFNKQLSVGLDVFEIWPLDWENVFANLKKLRATSLLLVLTTDTGDKSDFMGRVYAALDAWDASPDMELHIMLGVSFSRAEQVYRLVAKMRPDLLDKLYFWVNY